MFEESEKVDKKRNIRKSKSYYKEYLKYFLIVLLIPMLTIAIIISASKIIIEKQVLNSGRNTLYQLFRYVDEVLLEAKNLSVSLNYSDDLQLYSRFIIDKGSKGTYYSWKVNGLLDDNMNSKYYDIFCYYPERDYIISGINPAMKLEPYYNLYYDNEEDDFLDEFRNVAECTVQRPTIINMNGVSEDSYQCVAMRHSTGNTDYDYVTVIVIKSAYLSAILDEMDNGTLLFWDNKNESIFFAEEPLELNDLDFSLELYDTSDEMIEKDTHYVLIQNSKIMDFCYAYIIPKNYFEKELRPLYVIWGMGMTVSVIIGIWIAWKQTKKAYQPIGNIIVKAQQSDAEAYDAKEKTEFEFIEHLIKRKKEENETLSKSLRKMEKLKRDAFISALLNGKTKKDESLDDLFKEHGMNLYSDTFCIACFRVEHEPSDILSFAVVNVFEELLEREKLGYVVATNSTNFVILANVREEKNKEVLWDILDEGKRFWERFFDSEISFGISSSQDGLNGISAAYKEAQYALKYVFLLGKDKIIDYEEVADRESSYVMPSESKIVQTVVEYLTADSTKKNEKQLIQKIMADYEISETSSIEVVECYKYGVLNILNRVIVCEKCRPDEWERLLQALLNGETLEEFNIYLENILLQLYCKKQEQIENVDICTQAVEYIEAHYMDVNLSRTFLGEQLGISYPYLARLFKEKYQTTITDYIISVRIQCAKTELRRTEHSIQKIAENSGFTNSQTFIRTFKKIEGITPGAYREYVRNQGE